MLALAAVAARESGAEDRSHGWDGRVFLAVSGGYQPTRGSLAYGDTQTVFEEEASAQARLTQHGAPALDVSGGVRVFGPLGLGGTLSTVHARQSTTLTVIVPHPTLFGRPATATAVDSRQRNEVALHLQAILMVPVGQKLRLGLFGGPSRFWVRQPLASDAELEPTLNPDQSFVLTAPTLLYERASASAWGFHAGADVTLRVSRNVGLAGLARYSRGVAHAQNALRAARIGDVAKTVELELGGLSITGGLKLWF
jgi:hypothetical protein